MRKFIITLSILPLMITTSCAPRKIESFYKPTSKIGIYVEYSTDEFEKKYPTVETQTAAGDPNISRVATILTLADLGRLLGDTNKLMNFKNSISNTSIFISTNTFTKLQERGYEPSILLVENNFFPQKEQTLKLEFFPNPRQEDLKKYNQLLQGKDIDGLIHIRWKVIPTREQQIILIRSKLTCLIEITLLDKTGKIIYENLLRQEKFLDIDLPNLLESKTGFETILIDMINNAHVELFK